MSPEMISAAWYSAFVILGCLVGESLLYGIKFVRNRPHPYCKACGCSACECGKRLYK